MVLHSQNTLRYTLGILSRALFSIFSWGDSFSPGYLTLHTVETNHVNMLVHFSDALQCTDDVMCCGRHRDGDPSQWLVWRRVSLLCQRGETESLQAGQPLQARWPLQLGSIYKLLHYCEYNFTIMLQCTPAYVCSTRFVFLYVLLVLWHLEGLKGNTTLFSETIYYLWHRKVRFVNMKQEFTTIHLMYTLENIRMLGSDIPQRQSKDRHIFEFF